MHPTRSSLSPSHTFNDPETPNYLEFSPQTFTKDREMAVFYSPSQYNSHRLDASENLVFFSNHQLDSSFNFAKKPQNFEIENLADSGRKNPINTASKTLNSAKISNFFTFSTQKKAKSKNLGSNSKSRSSNLKVVSCCTCKKSRCRKNYCECFSLSKSCGDLCACLNCFNKIPALKMNIFSKEQLEMEERKANRHKEIAENLLKKFNIQKR